MKTSRVKSFSLSVSFLLFLVSLPFQSMPAEAESGHTESTTTLKIIGEERDVGLKRMEILEKALSPELLERKRAFVRSRELEYNQKIETLVQRLTTNIGRNTVITHIDIDYFALDFEPRIEAEENVTVTVLLDEDGLAKWAAGKKSREAAAEEMRTLIHGAFRIPLDRITIVVAPN
jgi:hypothetical protein